jgi:hypothetical protein
VVSCFPTSHMAQSLLDGAPPLLGNCSHFAIKPSILSILEVNGSLDLACIVLVILISFGIKKTLEVIWWLAFFVWMFDV